MFVSVKFFKFEFLVFFHFTKVNNCLSLNFKNLFFFIKKSTKLYSIIKFRCPVCHEGDFLEGHPYSIKHLGDVRQKCNSCDHYLRSLFLFWGNVCGLCIRGAFLLLFVVYLSFFPSCLRLEYFIVALLLLLAPFFHYQKLFMQISLRQVK